MKHCILIETETRTRLKTIATKAQTYDDIINELIDSFQKSKKEGI